MMPPLRPLLLAGALLAVALSPTSPAEEGKVIVLFRNGSTIPAHFDKTKTDADGAPAIVISSPYLNSPVSAHPSVLKEVILPDNVRRGEGQCMIRLYTNEQISGDLNQASSSGTSLRTLWGQDIQLPPEAVAYLNINNPGILIYSGTEDTTGWKGFTSPYPTPPRSWSAYRGAFLSMPPGGTISRDIKMPSAVHVSLVAQGKPFIRLLMHLWKDLDTPNPDKDTSYVDFHFLNDIFQITEVIHSTINPVANDPVSQERQEDLQQAQAPVAIDLFADRENGYYCLYVNKKLVKQCTAEKINYGEPDSVAPDGQDEAEKAPLNYGSGFSLESFDSVLMLTNLRVTQWNGQFPGTDLLPPEERLPVPRPDTTDNDLALLINGDALRGKIEHLSGRELLVQSDLYKVKVPLDKVVQIRMQAHAGQTLPDADEIRSLPVFYLTDGSILRGKLDKIENGTWTISSLSLGSVSIPDGMFSRIVFPEQASAAKRSSEPNRP